MSSSVAAVIEQLPCNDAAEIQLDVGAIPPSPSRVGLGPLTSFARRHRASLFDGALVVGVALAALFYCYKIAVFGGSAANKLELNEILLVSLIFFAGLVLFAARRLAEQARETRRRVVAEHEVLKAAAALRSAHRIAQLGGWRYDCATQRVSFSSELVEMIGGDTELDHAEAVDLWIEEDRDPFDLLLKDAAACGKPFSFEGRLVDPDGATRWMRVTGEPVFEHGRCVAMQGASQDITDWRASMDRLQTSEQAAHRAAAVMSAFLATMSHELRTPLNGVLGMAQIMAMGELSNKQRERLGIVQASGENLLGLLNNLLDLSQIEAGEVELEDGVIDAQTLADDARAMGTLLQGKDVNLTVSLAPNARGLWAGDPGRIRQILHNLVDNAVKFTEQGSIGVDLSRDGDRLVMRVQDTGIGIPAASLPYVFDRFVQADASVTRRFGGSGLGLAICRDLVAMMHGDIRVESIEGAGATFVASLPLESVGPGAAPAPSVAAPLAERLHLLVTEAQRLQALVSAQESRPPAPDAAEQRRPAKAG